MKKYILPIALLFAAVTTPAIAQADWSVGKFPLGPGYTVTHDSGSPDLVVNKVYKTERAAKKAAKALNKAEKKADK